MADHLIWAVAGFILIIAELLTGTFYLLVLGVAALIGALAAYLGAGLWVQVLLSVGAASLGVYCVHRWWLNHPKSAHSSNNLEIGQSVVLESWVNEAGGMARIRYRGSTWDAHVVDKAAINDVLYIQDQRNGVFEVGAKRPQ